MRGFVLYAIFFIVYAVNCRQKSSWETASETYGLYLRAQSDASVRPFDEMSNFVDSGQWLLDLGLQIAPALDKVCTNCRLGLTAEATALSQLGLDRFVCSDFDSTVGSVCRSNPCAHCAAFHAWLCLACTGNDNYPERNCTEADEARSDHSS